MSGDITCQHCDAEIAVDADVCPECGARTDVVSAMRAGADAVDADDADTTATTSCPDCGAEVAAQAVRCPECFAGLAGDGETGRVESLAGDAPDPPAPGYWHVAVASFMLAGAAGLFLTLVVPDDAGAPTTAGGWLVLANLFGLPVATYLDIRRLRRAAGWRPQTAVWVGLGVVPAVNVASAFVYLVRRNDAAATTPAE